MITGAHVILFSRDAEADRVFVRELLAVLEPVADQGSGLLTAIGLPGGGRVGLYEARHPTAFEA